MGTVSEVPEGAGDPEAEARERRIARSFQAYEDARTAWRNSPLGYQVNTDALGNMIGSVYDLVRELHSVPDEPEPLDTRINPYRLDRLVELFRIGLNTFLAQGDRADMIQFAAKFVQEQDAPIQRQLAEHWDEQRRRLSTWGL